MINLHGNGYPSRYTGQSQYILPSVKDGPPLANSVWSAGAGDIVISKWDGKTVLDHVAMDACRPDEWLLIDAWDER